MNNAKRNESNSMVAFALHVLNQELKLTPDDLDPDYINLFSAMREIPKAETQEEFDERHRDIKREQKKLEKEKLRKLRKSSILPPKVQRKNELWPKKFDLVLMMQGKKTQKGRK